MRAYIHHDFEIAAPHVSKMQRDGAVFLERLFTREALEALEEASRTLTMPPDQESEKRFTRLGYGDGPPARIVEELCRSDEFVRPITQLLGPHQVVTNLLLFELAPGQKGEEWHFGRRSFCFFDADTPAYTLWIPLGPVREKAEGGGLPWVPKNVFSAYSRIQQWSWVMRNLADGKRDLPLARARREQFGTGGDPWAGPFDVQICEANKVEQDFSLGDALLFGRNVWHRTSALRSVDLPNRKAVVLRFADGRAFVDKKLVAGFASNLRPHPEPFILTLLDADDSVPLGKQKFATPLGAARVGSDGL